MGTMPPPPPPSPAHKNLLPLWNPLPPAVAGKKETIYGEDKDQCKQNGSEWCIDEECLCHNRTTWSHQQLPRQKKDLCTSYASDSDSCSFKFHNFIL